MTLTTPSLDALIRERNVTPDETVAISFNFKTISTKLCNSITVILNVLHNILRANYKKCSNGVFVN